MQFTPIETRPFLPPQDDIYALLDAHVTDLKDGDVLFITSKILAIHQGRCVKVVEGIDKNDLIKKEAEHYITTKHIPNHEFILTIKDYTLIPSSGIDESNANGHYVLWPRETNKLLKEIRSYLQKKHGIKNLAVIATDSHTTPLRWGVTGISIGFCGMNPLYDYRGKEDIFGRQLQYSQANVVDALSAMAVLLMGEGNESTPLLVLRDADCVEFTDEDLYHKLIIEPKDDIYYPLLQIFDKRK